ncbi:MAG: T9SS type A sorting domain-containing protein [Bacteroidota bacterium]
MKACTSLTFVLLCWFVHSSLVFCQTPNFSLSIDLNKDVDQAWELVDLGDGLLIQRGGTCNQNTDICSGLIKTDYEGNVLWKKEYDYFGISNYRDLAVYKDKFYVTGRFNDERQQELVHHILEINSVGDTLCSFELPRDSHEYFRTLIANEQGLLLATNRVVGLHPIKLRQLDFDGNLLWQQWVRPGPRNVSARHLLPTPDDHYLLSYMAYQPGRKFSLGISKIDTLGEILWETIIDTVPDLVIPSGHIIKTQDDGYVTLFNEHYRLPYPLNDYPTVVYKLDQNGNIVWKTEFIYEFSKEPARLIETRNGDIVGAGLASFLNDQEKLEYGGYIFRLDKDGNKLWERYILDTLLSTIDRYGFFDDVVELTDGSLVFAGDIVDTFPNYEPVVNNRNIWLVNLDADGCFLPNCDSVQMHLDQTTSLIPERMSSGQWTVSPNPARQHLLIRWQGEVPPKRSQWTIYHFTGQKIWEGTMAAGNTAKEIDIGWLPAGQYVIRLWQQQGRYHHTQVFVKL